MEIFREYLFLLDVYFLLINDKRGMNIDMGVSFIYRSVKNRPQDVFNLLLADIKLIRISVIQNLNVGAESCYLTS